MAGGIGKKAIPLADDVAKAVISGSDDAAKAALSAISKGTPPSVWRTVRNPIKSFRASPGRSIGNVAKLGVGLGVGLPVLSGVAGKLGLLDFMNEDPSYDPSKIKYPKALSDQEIETEVTESRTGIDKIIEDMKTQALPYIPGAELFDVTTGMVNSMGGATLAEMQRLAEEQAGRGRNIQAGGAAGAADINAIYADAASQLENSAIQGGEYGGMVPVSGEAYAAPGQAQEAGASLADYLGQSQLITAQDQGFLSELSNILGPAYANQFAMQQQVARAQAEVNKQRQTAQLQMQRDQAYQDALIQSQLLKEEDRRTLKEKSEALAKQFIPQEVLEGYAGEWDSASDDYKKALAAMEGIEVKSKEDYINYRLQTDFGV